MIDYPLDRSKWPSGVWDHEGDLGVWELPNGLHAIIRRNHMGAWCGYVGIPPDHPWFGRSYNTKTQPNKAILERRVDINEVCVFSMFLAVFGNDDPEQGLPLNLTVRVHGGLTFAAPIPPQHGGKDGWWYFGFDCAHSGDYQPGLDQHFSAEFKAAMASLRNGAYKEIYRTEEFVRSEVAHLSEELLNVPPPCVEIDFTLVSRTSRNQREGRYLDRLKAKKGRVNAIPQKTPVHSESAT